MYRVYDAEDALIGLGDHDESLTVLQFWRWAFGNLNEDRLKGLFAEWLVGRLLGLELKHAGRNGGANSDLITRDGVRIEVKSTAYWQSWKLYTEDGTPIPPEEIEARHWDRLEKPLTFQVRRTRDSVDRSGAKPKLWSHLYIFAVQFERDPIRWNILDMDQWRFYCLTRDEVLSLPQSFAEHRMESYCQPLTARELTNFGQEKISEVQQQENMVYSG